MPKTRVLIENLKFGNKKKRLQYYVNVV